MNTEQKALAINLDAGRFGTFAEIGAGQEGGALQVFPRGPCLRHSGFEIDLRIRPTAVSDEIYGKARPLRQPRASGIDARLRVQPRCCDVSMPRAARRPRSSFSPIPLPREPAPIVPAAMAGWAFAFQTVPRTEAVWRSSCTFNCSDNVASAFAKQEALGTLGVNLIHAAFFPQSERPHELVAALIEGLRRSQVEVDMIRLSGPAFAGRRQPPHEPATGGTGPHRRHHVHVRRRSGAAFRSDFRPRDPDGTRRVPARHQRDVGDAAGRATPVPLGKDNGGRGRSGLWC